jgi:hypothetical protein
MAKQKTWFFLSAFALVVSFTMKYVGDTNRALSELQDFWYIPLPLAVIWFMTGVKKGNSTDAVAEGQSYTTTPDSD